jgi:hypothetical protein
MVSRPLSRTAFLNGEGGGTCSSVERYEVALLEVEQANAAG